MKTAMLTVSRQVPGAAFQIHRLGLREKMKPCIVDRPEGTQDYLFMLFHARVQVRTRRGEESWGLAGPDRGDPAGWPLLW